MRENLVYFEKFAVYNLTPPKVRLNSHAQNAQKCENFVWWRVADTLWRSVPSAAVLPSNQASIAADQQRAFCSAEHSLHHQRFDLGRSLSDRSGPWTHRDHSIASAERSLPIHRGAADVSKPYEPETIYREAGNARSGSVDTSAQSVAGRSYRRAFFGYLRFGHYGSDSLRSTTGSTGWLQSQETRPSILPTAALLRREHQRCMVWKVSVGGCVTSPTYEGASRRGLRTASFWRSYDPRSCGCGFLQPRNRNVFDRKTGFLCHSCTYQVANQIATEQLGLPKDIASVGAQRVHLSATKVEASRKVYCGASARSRRTFLATFSFQDGGLHLSCVRDKSSAQAFERVALLQSACQWRTDYSGADRSLCLGENPHRRVGFESGLLPSCASCLQPSELVQTFLSSAKLATFQSSNHSRPSASGASRTGSTAGQTNTENARFFPLREGLSGNVEKHRTIPETTTISLVHVFDDSISCCNTSTKMWIFTQDSG